MIQATQPQIIPPGATIEGVPNAGNPTQYALILAPLTVDKQVVGLIEILMDPSRRAATQKSTLRFVSDLCDLAASYLKNRQMRQVMSQQRLWNQLEGFTHQIHASLDLKESAYAVANDGKRLVGCDRLSVALKIGGRVMVEAVSGQEVVEQRANLIRELTRLCKVVIRSGEDLVYTGNTEGFAPDIRDALELYVDESGSKAVIVTLLHKPETDAGGNAATSPAAKEKVPFGCLVSEQIGDEMAPSDAHARTEVVARHASTALWNAQEHDKIFMLPLLKVMGSPWRFFRGRTLAKIVGVLSAIIGVVLVLTFVPWKLTIEGRGSLLPENPADHLRPGRRDRGRRPRRARPARQEGGPARQDRQPRASAEAQGDVRADAGVADAGELPEPQAAKASESGQRRRIQLAPGPAPGGEDQVQERPGADREHRRGDRVDERPGPRLGGRHDLGDPQEPPGPPRRDRPGTDHGRRPEQRLGDGGRRPRRRHGPRSSAPRASSTPRSPRARRRPATRSPPTS